MRYSLTVAAGDPPSAALGRLLIRAETATLEIPELGFEIPGRRADCAALTRAEVCTVASLLAGAARNLALNQSEREAETASKIGVCIAELTAAERGWSSFTVTLEDPSGNSLIGGPAGEGSGLAVERFERTPEQAAFIGLGGGGGEEKEEEQEEEPREVGR